eukprot:gene149-399_t
MTDRAQDSSQNVLQGTDQLKIGILGSGNWGSAIAINVGTNAKLSPDFKDEVNMWVFEEKVGGRKLTEIINEDHENVKYLPGYKLPENVVAVPDAAKVAEGCDILVIVLPHQFLPRLLASIKDSVKKSAVIVSLIKGQLDIEVEDGKPKIELGSELISNTLGIPCGVLMGANVASNVAAKEFTESTLALPASASEKVPQKVLTACKEIFNTPTFVVGTCNDVPTAELCGGLKNIVALGAGFCDGQNLGISTKAAVMRMGLKEMQKFIKHFFPEAEQSGDMQELVRVACDVSKDESAGVMKTWDPECQQLAKNLVGSIGFASGLCDGMSFGSNTKASIMRIGLVESVALLRVKFPENDLSDAEFALFNSIVEASYSGENRRLGEVFAKQDPPPTPQENKKSSISTSPSDGSVTKSSAQTLSTSPSSRWLAETISVSVASRWCTDLDTALSDDGLSNDFPFFSHINDIVLAQPQEPAETVLPCNWRSK